MSDIIQTPNSPSPGTPMSPNFPFNPSNVDSDTQPTPTLAVGSNGTNDDGSPRAASMGVAPGGGQLMQPSRQAESREDARNNALVAGMGYIAAAIGGSPVGGDDVSVTSTYPLSTIGASGGPYVLKLDPTGTVTITVVNGLITVIV